MLLFNLCCCLFMTGLIWFVQVAHYPLFSLAERIRFREFSEAHQRRTTWVVMPVMLAELVTAALLILHSRTNPERVSAGFAFALLVGIWLSTALWQVPAHQKLLQGFDELTHRWLVRSNWVRTILWTVRSAILAGLQAQVHG
ncbi:MAG: hypothetical protein K1X57_08010 [Gemmataceae bacterium]|nr:hypothetical protein [Gemmataceae bacterium]